MRPSQNNKRVVWAIGGCLFLAALLFLNHWVLMQVNGLEKPTVAVNVQQVVVSEAPPSPPPTGEVTRRTITDPSREFAINTISVGGQEVAHFRSVGIDILDLEGAIPDGKITFVDESNQTYGEEVFKDNRRHGPYKEFYNNGQLKKELNYSHGKVNALKEYFFDGTLRMEADYQDAFLLSEDKDMGKGKVYYRSGKLMYEWNLTNFDKNKYKKSYNTNGELVETKTYDSEGKLISKISHENNLQPVGKEGN